MNTHSNTFAKGFVYGFAAGIEALDGGLKTASLPPGTRLFKDVDSREPRLALPITPDPSASPEEVLEAFKSACACGDFAEAGRWTIPAPLTLERESLTPARPWEGKQGNAEALVLCEIDGCWRVARMATAVAAAAAL